MSAPDGGYGFHAKEVYRRKFWSFVDQAMRVVPRKRRTVVILDTSEGHECRYLLKRGYAPERIHVVNNNPAEVAWLTRRLRDDGLPAVQTHGRELLEVTTALQREGPVHVINYDACSQIGWGAIPSRPEEWRGWWASYLHNVGLCVARGGVLGHTFLVGRERGDVRDVLTKWTGTAQDRGRTIRQTYLVRLNMATIFLSAMSKDRCERHIDDLVFDYYLSSSGQVMLWFAAKLVPHAPLSIGQCMERARRRHGDGDRFFALTLPWCGRQLAGPEDYGAEDTLLFRTGSFRFRGTSSSGPSSDVGDEPFDPCGIAAPVSTVMRV